FLLPITARCSPQHPATPDIYTLSLHDALPIYRVLRAGQPVRDGAARRCGAAQARLGRRPGLATQLVPGRFAAGLRQLVRPRRRRSEEHTSELQSRENLVCRLLLEKKKKENARS